MKNTIQQSEVKTLISSNMVVFGKYIKPVMIQLRNEFPTSKVSIESDWLDYEGKIAIENLVIELRNGLHFNVFTLSELEKIHKDNFSKEGMEKAFNRTCADFKQWQKDLDRVAQQKVLKVLAENGFSFEDNADLINFMR